MKLVKGVLRRRLSTVAANWPSSSVRKTFIEFFEREHNHLAVPSSPVIPPAWDPTLPFVNSGMNQFKEVFLGRVTPASRRVVNSQKCVRIKGKHNDLNLIGVTGRHHAFFEMLGNWSFGDYFKKEACAMAWTLLTEVYSIPAERLYVTYFSGDESLGLPPDLETREIWAEIGVPSNRILPFGMKDNFWEMGSTGPCGPCTEIHYDQVPGRTDAAALVNSESREVIEIWNLVFTEFNRLSPDVMHKLDQHFVDTGLGLERLVALLQGQTSNYETDLFKPLYAAIQKISSRPEYTGSLDGNNLDVAYRQLADFSRMLTVALSDGAIPNNNQRVRSCARRAMLISHNVFGVKKGILKELSNLVAESLAPVYPEIGENLNFVQGIIGEEEDNFWEKNELAEADWRRVVKEVPKMRTLDVNQKAEFVSGYKFLKKNVLIPGARVVSTGVAWKLVDTLGVPYEMMLDMFRVLGLEFDQEAYAKFLEKNTEAARLQNQKRFTSTNSNQSGRNLVDRFRELGLAKTDDSAKHVKALGVEGLYWFPILKSKILAIVAKDNLVDRIVVDKNEKDRIGLLLDKTSFLAKTEAHASDFGRFTVSNGVVFRLDAAEYHDGYIVHQAKYIGEESTEISVNQIGSLEVNESGRVGKMIGNTALQLLKSVLKKRIKTLREKNSFVDWNAFQYTFLAYMENLTVKEIAELENEINEVVQGPLTLKWDHHDVRDVWKMKDLIVPTGQTFIESKIPILEISSPILQARLFCPFPVIDCIRDVQKVLITQCLRFGNLAKTIHGLTGSAAHGASQHSDALLREWVEIRDFHVTAELMASQGFDVTDEINRVKGFLLKISNASNISYYIRESIKEESRAKLLRLEKFIRRNIKEEKKFTRKYGTVMDLTQQFFPETEGESAKERKKLE